MFGFGAKGFNPETDIPDLTGKVYLVTGGNIGLGYETILQLSKHNPAQVYCAARNPTAAAEAIEKIKKAVPSANVQFLELDLASFASVKAAAQSFTKSSQRLDSLVNNAGIMACPPRLTKDGYETQFGTNYMGHALLTKLLLPTLQDTAKRFPGTDVSIINVSSAANTWAPKEGLLLQDVSTKMEDISTIQRYGQSKLANILHAKELAKRYPEIRVVAIHPGTVNTGLGRGIAESWPWLSYPLALLSPLMVTSLQVGALNHLWSITSKEAQSGKFYYPVGKLTEGFLYNQHEQLQEKLWGFTEKEFAAKGY